MGVFFDVFLVWVIVCFCFVLVYFYIECGWIVLVGALFAVFGVFVAFWFFNDFFVFCVFWCCVLLGVFEFCLDCVLYCRLCVGGMGVWICLFWVMRFLRLVSAWLV